MKYEDRTLTCTACNAEFVFSAGEQEFYAEKGLTSEPKRCKSCRDARRQKRRQNRKGDGIYRSPAFENSAPAHQKIRGQRGPHRRGRGEYRSPGLNDGRPGRNDYRSPAFREYETIKPEQEYRSPGFREYDDIKPEEEYRSPGFREYADIDVKQEYRAPGYQETAKKYVDEKPMFTIVCSGCGAEAMVPFLPDEREEALCEACYQKKREHDRAEKEAKRAAENDTEASADADAKRDDG
jgi:CxxC-x17-CxxC domain-containing protein